LTDAEFARIEGEYGFEFADDHRAFLAEGLPLNTPLVAEPGVSHAWERPWPDWRGGDGLVERLRVPVEGVLFDVQNNAFWHGGWGERPADMAEALGVARVRLAEVPQLVPVYSHRFLPAGRGTFGHPVLSVSQTDIIYYGLDLADYIDQEFRGRNQDTIDQAEATAAFWRDIC
jgi:hypothetical protein